MKEIWETIIILGIFGGFLFLVAIVGTIIDAIFNYFKSKIGWEKIYLPNSKTEVIYSLKTQKDRCEKIEEYLSEQKLDYKHYEFNHQSGELRIKK